MNTELREGQIDTIEQRLGEIKEKLTSMKPEQLASFCIGLIDSGSDVDEKNVAEKVEINIETLLRHDAERFDDYDADDVEDSVFNTKSDAIQEKLKAMSSSELKRLATALVEAGVDLVDSGYSVEDIRDGGESPNYVKEASEVIESELEI